jgi:hypothetical protein
MGQAKLNNIPILNNYLMKKHHGMLHDKAIKGMSHMQALRCKKIHSNIQ